MVFSDPGLDPTFQLFSDPTRIFSNILNINFTFVFPSLGCILCKLFREIFLTTNKFIFLNWAFFKSPNFTSFSEKFYFKFISDPKMLGSGMIFSDPTGSRSTTVLSHRQGKSFSDWPHICSPDSWNWSLSKIKSFSALFLKPCLGSRFCVAGAKLKVGSSKLTTEIN